MMRAAPPTTGPLNSLVPALKRFPTKALASWSCRDAFVPVRQVVRALMLTFTQDAGGWRRPEETWKSACRGLRSRGHLQRRRWERTGVTLSTAAAATARSRSTRWARSPTMSDGLDLHSRRGCHYRPAGLRVPVLRLLAEEDDGLGRRGLPTARSRPSRWLRGDCSSSLRPAISDLADVLPAAATYEWWRGWRVREKRARQSS